ncbi:short-subunit dehydrogenase [Lewinella antarctica]|uniref:Short-subunit dehydrogenase n=1 Tax=Neolewinella antarctica TaxID=442734 RepID=A0ABX0XFU5_9BACT|nr:short-subunit dehydrogenase [Neolewinella antarctica]
MSSPFPSIYSAIKFAVEAITDGMRRELMPFGIDVISIAPGPVKTPIWGKGKLQTAAYEDNRYSSILARLDTYTEKANAGGLEPEVVAAAILNALEDHRQRPDQLVTKRGWMAKLVLRLPKRLQDRLIRGNLDNDRRY